MDIRIDIKAFTDQYGLITPDGKPSGNGLLYTAEYLALLHQRGELTKSDEDHFRDVILSCEKRIGLFNRHPDHPDQQAPDDYMGIACASALIDPAIARSVLFYGRSIPAKASDMIHDSNLPLMVKMLLLVLVGDGELKYNYNNVTPGTASKNSWMGRQPQLIGGLQMAAQEKLSTWRLIYWCLVIATSGLFKPQDQDSWRLSYLCLYYGSNYNWMTKLTAQVWWRRFKKHWPGGVKELRAKYFNNSEHPLSKYVEDKPFTFQMPRH